MQESAKNATAEDETTGNGTEIVVQDAGTKHDPQDETAICLKSEEEEVEVAMIGQVEKIGTSSRSRQGRGEVRRLRNESLLPI